MQKKPIFLIITLAVIFIGLAYYLGTQKGNVANPLPSPTPTSVLSPLPTVMACTEEAKICPDGSAVGRSGPDCEFAPCPTIIPSPTILPTPTVKAGWTSYKNEEYGFEISYPEKYEIVDDKYGWPKAVVLLYDGGQSYDLAIEAWDSVSEYETKYKSGTENLTVKKVGEKYITLLNMNFEEEVDEIIATFKIVE